MKDIKKQAAMPMRGGTNNWPAPSPQEVITVSVATARCMTDLGTTKIFELLASGQLKRVKVGRRTLITMDSIRALIERG